MSRGSQTFARISSVLLIGLLAGVRAGAPYTPLPPEIKGESASFDLPLVSISR